jgi:membrane-bound serine protease (ClpP class)
MPGNVQASKGDQVYVVSLKNEITPAMSAYLVDQIELANAAQAKGLIVDISTLGGRVDSALEMRDAMLASEIPIVVFVGDRATSAGALITIAADTIIMAPGSHMGAAEPIPYTEKTVAYVSGEFRSTAEARGRDTLIAAGMADKQIEVPGFPRGKLVNITAEEASSLDFIDGIQPDIAGVLDYMNWQDAQLLEVEPDGLYKIAQFLTRSEVASIILIIALLTMVIEIFLAGFGISGIISIVAFALYFGGAFLAGNTEWWSVILFVLGLAFLIIEFFVPGFGIFGVSGILMILIGIVFAAPTIGQGFFTIVIAVAATAILIPILYKLFGGPKLFRRLVLDEAETVDKGYVNIPDNSLSGLLGKTGDAITPLRPAGIIVVDGKRLDAISDGSYMPSGEKIRIVEVQGTKIVVTRQG